MHLSSILQPRPYTNFRAHISFRNRILCCYNELRLKELCNCQKYAVQDGHGMLPMLADSRREFVVIKAINFAVGLVIGAAALAVGY